MARTPQHITDAELDLLHLLWKHGPLTIRRLTELLYGDSKTSQYATVQKLLERLESKACVQRDRTANVHVLRATIERDELVGRRLQAVAEDLCDGSWTPLLTNFVQTKKLTEEERQMLRQLINEHDALKAKKDRRERK